MADARDAASCGSLITRPSEGGSADADAPLKRIVMTGQPQASSLARRVSRIIEGRVNQIVGREVAVSSVR